MTSSQDPNADSLAHEVRIQKAYAERLADQRPLEKLMSHGYRFDSCGLIADMATIDKSDVMRIWEFKIDADYRSLGQIITYIAHARYEELMRWAPPSPHKRIVGVLAAFTFQPEVLLANVVMNCGIEIVVIPPFLRNAGDVPPAMPRPHVPNIPPT
jgi:hypothetical protein